MKAKDKTKEEIVQKLAEMHQRLSQQKALEAEVQRAKRALQESEERYQTLLERTFCCVYVHDFEGRFLEANQAALNLLGYEKEDVPSLKISSLLGENQLPEALKAIEEAKQSGFQTTPRVYRLRRKNGDEVWVEAEGTIVYRHGEPFAIQVVAVDITERKRAQQELKGLKEQLEALVKERTAELKRANEQLKRELKERELAEETLRKSEERYRDLVERSPLGFLIVQSLPPRVVFANRAAGEILGYTTDELMSLLPEEVKELAYPGDLSRLMACYQDLRQGKQLFQPCQVRVVRKNGTRRRVEIVGSRIDGEENPAVQVSFVDITAGEVTEGERLRSAEGKPEMEGKEEPQDQLLQTRRLEDVAALAGKVARAFNELLTAIQEGIDLALQRIDQKNPVYRDLKHIEEVSMGTANLARQLLLFSGQQPMRFVTIDLNRMVEILSKMLKRLIGEDIDIVTELEPALWSVQADVGYIEQVIVNLVTNARDAMSKGGKLEIKTENVTLGEDSCEDMPDARPGKFVCLSVADTGKGVEKTTLSRIFEPFFSTKGQAEHPGLGLSVAYGVIKQHKGWIAVISEPGRGATFKIYLPARSPRLEDERKEEREDTNTSKGSEG